MKKIVRLTESDLTRIVRRTIKENEQKSLMQAIESDSEISGQFEKIVRYLRRLDPEQQQEIEDVVSDVSQSQGEYTEGKETRYYDYGGDRPQEISKSHFIKRKLSTVLPPAIVGAIMGIAMAGGTNAADVLEMALGMAAAGGAIGAGLISTVGRQEVDVPDEESDDTFMSESYNRKKVIRLTESDLVRLVKKVIQEQSVSFEKKILKGDTIQGKRSIDGKTYTIKIEEKIDNANATAKITGPGKYQGNKLDGTRTYEVNIFDYPKKISGNKEMGDFTDLEIIWNNN
jgi:hypothetical protein